MPDNDQYTKEKHGTFTPVGVILVIAICGLVAVFLYHRIEGGPGLGAEVPAAATGDGANPNQLAPAPVQGQNSTAP